LEVLDHPVHAVLQDLGQNVVNRECREILELKGVTDHLERVVNEASLEYRESEDPQDLRVVQEYKDQEVLLDLRDPMGPKEAVEQLVNLDHLETVVPLDQEVALESLELLDVRVLMDREDLEARPDREEVLEIQVPVELLVLREDQDSVANQELQENVDLQEPVDLMVVLVLEEHEDQGDHAERLESQGFLVEVAL